MSVDNDAVLKMVAQFTLPDGTIAQNIFHYKTVFASAQSDANVLTALEEQMESLYGQLVAEVTEDLVVDIFSVHEVEWDDEEDIWATTALVGEFLPTIAFSSITDWFPNQVSAVLIGNTARPKTRGKTFLTGLGEGIATGGEMTAPVMVHMLLALADYIAQVEVTPGNDMNPGVPRTAENVFWRFVLGEVITILGSQRRRMRGVGS